MGRSSSTNSREAISHLRARNREFGNVLATARHRQRKSLSECAAYIATSRSRYAAIEQGTTPIHAAELELLLDYLNIPVEQVWPASVPTKGQHVVVTLEPGEVVNVLVKRRLLGDERNQTQEGKA